MVVEKVQMAKVGYNQDRKQQLIADYQIECDQEFVAGDEDSEQEQSDLEIVHAQEVLAGSRDPARQVIQVRDQEGVAVHRKILGHQI